MLPRKVSSSRQHGAPALVEGFLFRSALLYSREEPRTDAESLPTNSTTTSPPFATPPKISLRLDEFAEVIRSTIAEGCVRQTAVAAANQVLPDLRRIGGLLNHIAKRLPKGGAVDVLEVHQDGRREKGTGAG